MATSPLALVRALLLFAFVGHLAAATPISVAIDHDDGGKTAKRHLRTMLRVLKESGCHVATGEEFGDTPAQLVFDSRPTPIGRAARPNYRLIARAKTLDGELSVRGSVLVHASTGISDLSSLQGQRVAFVGKGSWAGYRLPLQLLHDAGVVEERDTFFYVGNHVGTISMLMHSDVFVAVTAEPLARRWARPNDLSIVAVTDAVETGGWWLHNSVPDERAQVCAQAIGGLERPRHKALPAWIDGFAVALEPD